MTNLYQVRTQLTQGFGGPPGPKGDKGDKGDPGGTTPTDAYTLFGNNTVVPIPPIGLTVPQVKTMLGYRTLEEVDAAIDEALDDWVVTWDRIEIGTLPLDRLPSVVGRKDQSNAWAQPQTFNSYISVGDIYSAAINATGQISVRTNVHISDPINGKTSLSFQGAGQRGEYIAEPSYDHRVAMNRQFGTPVFHVGSYNAGSTWAYEEIRAGGAQFNGNIDFVHPSLGINQWWGVESSNGLTGTDYIRIRSHNTGVEYRFRRDGVLASQGFQVNDGPRLKAVNGSDTLQFRNGGDNANANIVANAAAFQAITVGDGTGYNAILLNTVGGNLQTGWSPGGFFGMDSTVHLGIRAVNALSLLSSNGALYLDSKFGLAVRNEVGAYGPMAAGLATFNAVAATTTINNSGVEVNNPEAVSSTVRVGAAYNLPGLYGSTLNYISENDKHVFRRGGGVGATPIATFNATQATFAVPVGITNGSTGRLGLGPDDYIESDTTNLILRQRGAGSTYVDFGASTIFRRTSDFATMATIASNGTANFLSTVTTPSVVSHGLSLVDAVTGVLNWRFYKNTSDSNLYLRNEINARMHAAFSVGADSATSNSYFYSNLTVEGDLAVGSNIDLYSNGDIYANNLINAAVLRTAPFDLVMFHSGNYSVTFGTNNLERMRVDPNGRVGIGTAFPATKLDVQGDITATGFLKGNRVFAEASNGFSSLEAIHPTGRSYRWVLNNDDTLLLQSSTDKFVANGSTYITVAPTVTTFNHDIATNGYVYAGNFSTTGGITLNGSDPNSGIAIKDRDAATVSLAYSTVGAFRIFRSSVATDVAYFADASAWVRGSLTVPGGISATSADSHLQGVSFWGSQTNFSFPIIAASSATFGGSIGFSDARLDRPVVGSAALRTYETSLATWQEPWRGQASATGARIAFLGATPIVRQSLPAAATDAATTQTLANALRSLAINFGLAN